MELLGQSVSNLVNICLEVNRGLLVLPNRILDAAHLLVGKCDSFDQSALQVLPGPHPGLECHAVHLDIVLDRSDSIE